MNKFKRMKDRLTVRMGILLSALLLLFLSTALAGSWAWHSDTQNALNMGRLSAEAREIHLLKREIDVEGQKTERPVPGAQFLLFEIPAHDQDNPVQIHKGEQSTFTTDDKGRITVTLPPGRYYFLEILLPDGFGPDRDAQNHPLRRYDFTVYPESTNDKPIVTVFNRRLSGDLILEKRLENDDGKALSQAQKEQFFEFRVIFSDGGTYYYRINGEGDEHPLVSGKTLRLRHGQKAVFTRIPIGVHYEIEEIGAEPSLGHHASGNIHAEPSHASFVNRATVRNLILEKEVVNSDGSTVTEEQKEIDFEFEINLSNVPEDAHFRYTTNRYQIDTLPDNDDQVREGVISDGGKIVLRHGEVLTIHELPVGAVYKIRELSKTGFVSRTQLVEGQIVKGHPSTYLFINEYQVEGYAPVLGILSFAKEVISDDPADKKEYFEFRVIFRPNEGVFSYRIINIEDGEEVGGREDFQSGEVIRLRHGQKVIFDELPPGLTYRIEEIVTPEYFETLSSLEGNVLDGNQGSEGEENNLPHLFVNSDIPEGKAQLILEKRVEGVGYDPHQEFVFDLYINDVRQDKPIRLRSGESSAPIILELEDSWRVVERDLYNNGFSQEGLENGYGTVEMEHIGRNIFVRQTNHYVRSTIDLSGVKTWQKPEGIDLPEKIRIQLLWGEMILREIDVLGPDWAYNFSSLPKFDNEGKEISYRIREVPISGWKSVTNPTDFNLHNIWIAPINLSLEVEKQLTGDESPEDETFEFVMNPGNQVARVTNSGRVHFPQISFNRPGTFEFTIHEARGNSLGWTYDSTEYKWFVKIEKADDDSLRVKEQWLTKNGERIDGLKATFVNKFDRSALIKETLDIPVKKTWEHKELTQDLHPKEVIVKLMAGEKEVGRRQLSQSGKWQAVFREMPRYDEEGREINYQLHELPVNGYRSEVNGKAQTGFQVHNTYVGMKIPPSKTPTPEPPKTRDPLPEVGDTFRITVIVLGLAFLRIAYILYREKGRH